MSNKPRFQAAYPFQTDVLALPVTDLETAAKWYCQHFGMVEIERRQEPDPTVILERDAAQIGFAINHRDPEQDGAAVLVSNIQAVRDDLESRGIKTGNWRVDEREGQEYQVFFVVAPDGLCYYFHEPLQSSDNAA